MQIKPMPLRDVRTLLAWANDEGWNPGHDDAESFYATDPDGFFMAVVDNEPVAGISVVSYDENNGFLGLYICHPNYRAQGIGLALWNRGMQYLEGKCVGLDGVVEQQNNYKKSGFEFAYRNIRFTGTSKSILTGSTAGSPAGANNLTFQSLQPGHWPAVRRFDLDIHGFDRKKILNHWLINTNYRRSLVCIEQGKVIGFGTIRQCQRGCKIGPLIAPDELSAQALLFALASERDNFSELTVDDIVLDVPEPNATALSLAEQIGMKSVFETARMYRGTAPNYQLDSLYGVTTFELG